MAIANTATAAVALAHRAASCAFRRCVSIARTARLVGTAASASAAVSVSVSVSDAVSAPLYPRMDTHTHSLSHSHAQRPPRPPPTRQVASIIIHFVCKHQPSSPGQASRKPRDSAVALANVLLFGAKQDYDAFYASVIEAETPSLRTRPLAVQQKQIVVTCNYEARRRVRLPWSHRVSCSSWPSAR
jgi:hypothetical protein